MQNLKQSFLNELRIPEINGDRCVHAHIETASCEACVTACPQQAWILDDESLGLNTSACDGCGICVPACSEGAILQVRDCTIREENRQKVLLLGCELTGLNEANCRCIHAVSVNDLLNIYRDGIRKIHVSTGYCTHCSRAKNESLYQRINHINKMLQHSDLAPIEYDALSPENWRKLCKTPEKSAPGPEMSRRMFFRSALKQTVDRVLHQSTFDSTDEFVPPAKILELSDTEESIYPAVPHFIETQCNGCDACIKTCPHQALRFEAGDEQACYQIDAAACTACQICVDICNQDAIEIGFWQLQTQHTVPLAVQTCRSCGAHFHHPFLQQVETGSVDELCPICTRINHQKHLFQVLD